MKNRDNSTIPINGIKYNTEKDTATQNVIFDNDGSVQTRGGLSEIVPAKPKIVEMRSFTTMVTAAETIDLFSEWELVGDGTYDPTINGYRTVRPKTDIPANEHLWLEIEPGSGKSIPLAWSLLNTDAMFSIETENSQPYLKLTGAPDTADVTIANGWIGANGSPQNGMGNPLYWHKNHNVTVHVEDARSYTDAISFNVGLIEYHSILSGNPVTDSLVVELLAENLVAGGAGNPDTWTDTSGNNNDATQTDDLYKFTKTLEGAHYYLDVNTLGQYMSLTTFNNGDVLDNDANTIVMMMRYYPTGYSNSAFGFWYNAAAPTPFYKQQRNWVGVEQAMRFCSDAVSYDRGELFPAGMVTGNKKIITFDSYGDNGLFSMGAISCAQATAHGAFPYDGSDSLHLMAHPNHNPAYGTAAHLYAILIYKKKLSAGEKADVEAWLVGKYGATDFP